MKIFILNSGSSSIKCFLYDFGNELLMKPNCSLWEAHLQWKNDFEKASLTIQNFRGARYSEVVKEKTPELALKYLMKFLFEGELAVIDVLSEIDVVGHRVVHGGAYFKDSVYITAEVKEKIRFFSELSPLHNPAELKVIEIMEHLLKNTPQIAVFDTAFHSTLPKVAQIYPGPYSWYQEGIQRFGFHGISFQYCSRQAAKLLNCSLNSLSMVICHLGSGASLCAIKDGKSIDTTMGFTPLEGLMMDTRSGSIDPGIIMHLLKKMTPEEILHILYNESGLLGVSGISSDMYDIIQASLNNNPRATMAFDIYIHRLNALMGAMIATLKGIDTLVFTAGIGENAPLVREKVCDNFCFLGLKLDKSKNEQISMEDRELSASNSRIKVLIIHTQEAFQIACECWSKISGSQL